jgi:dTDP-4-amino-4,6-dideoxygalactose transaminase
VRWAAITRGVQCRLTAGTRHCIVALGIAECHFQISSMMLLMKPGRPKGKKMGVPFYGHTRQYHNIQGEIDARMAEVVESSQFTLGPALTRFEAEFAAYSERKHVVGVGNGTDALWLTMMALDLQPGDEVITNANTFFATVEAIWIAGGTAVLVDCDERTRCIDPARIVAAIGPRTRGIIAVHLYGQCAPMRAIRELADRHQLFLLEDNAQAIDARGDDFRIGDLSDAVTTSFIIQKNLGAFGDGGAVYTDRDDIEARVRLLRNHGSNQRNHHSFGFNSRLDDLHAAVLSAKLKHITAWTDQRRSWAARYDAGLADISSIRLPFQRPGYRHAFHLYVLETRDTAKRNHLLAYLNGRGIDAKTHYSIPIHLQEGFPWGKNYQISGSLANAERNAASCVSLPMFPELTAAEVDEVIDAVRTWAHQLN